MSSNNNKVRIYNTQKLSFKSFDTCILILPLSIDSTILSILNDITNAIVY